MNGQMKLGTSAAAREFHGTPVALIVEDRALLAESLKVALTSSEVRVETITTPSLEIVANAVDRAHPTVALVAMGIGRGRLTEDVIGLLCDHGIPTIVMTGGEDRLRLARCVAVGAVGIVDKSIDVETLTHMIRHAGGIDSLLSARQRNELEDELRRHRSRMREQMEPLEQLTPREREVLMDLTRGLLAKEIADRSFVSISTVRSQIKSILAKLGVRSQVQAIAVATQSHWFAVSESEFAAS
jgi:DNA-binding NarL/FixJ family response regulator